MNYAALITPSLLKFEMSGDTRFGCKYGPYLRVSHFMIKFQFLLFYSIYSFRIEMLKHIRLEKQLIFFVHIHLL